MKTEEQSKQLVEFVPFGTKDKIELSIEVVKRLIAVKTKSGKQPSDEDAFKFMLMCQARRLNPFEGDAYLIGYDGQHGPSFSLITAHQAFLKRAELHPEFDGMESGTIVLREAKITDLVGDWHMPSDKILGGWATVYFKNRSHPMTKRVRLERFNKGYGIWRDDPAGMVVKCAEADALRSSFPTMLGGMFISEEMSETTTADIPRAVFPESEKTAANGGTVVEVSPAVEPRKTAEPEPKKKAPTLVRKSQKARSVPTDKAATISASHSKMIEQLALGAYTAHDLVAMLLDEGWIELAQGTFEKIPEDRMSEFLQPENWEVIMQLLDEKIGAKKAAAAERGNLL